MKRILTILLAFIVVFSFPVFGEDVNANAEIPSAVELLTKLGIVSESSSDILNSENNVTRGEFALVIAEVAQLPEITKNGFSDVNPGSRYEKAVNAVCSAKIMNGVGEGLFAPESEIKEIEAAAVILRLLGYEELCRHRGGYPSGYYAVMRETSLSNGIGAVSGNVLSGDKLAGMLKNMLNERLYETISVSGNNFSKGTSEKTFSEIYYGISMVEGIMRANTVTTLERPGENSGIIINETMLFTEDKSFDRFIGYYCEAYYDYESGTPLYIVPGIKNKVTVINADDILVRNGTEITYNVNNTEKKITVPSGAHILYNGIVAGSFSYSNLDIEDGEILFIDNGGGNGYDVVSVKSYETVIVDSVNAIDEAIYLKNGKGVISAEELKDAVIYDTKGRTNLNWLVEWNTLSLLRTAEGKLLEIHSSGKLDAKTPSVIGDDDNGAYIEFTDGTVSRVHASQRDNVKELVTGQSYLFSFDINGKITAFTADRIMKLAVVTLCREVGSFEKQIVLRLYTEFGDLETFTLEGKINVDGVLYDTAKQDEQNKLFGVLKVLKESVVEYETDAKEKLSKINTMDVVYTSNGSNMYIYGNVSNVITDDKAKKSYFLKKNARAFYIPYNDISTAEEKDFSVRLTSKVGIQQPDIIVYKRKDNTSAEADAIRLYRSGSGASSMDTYEHPSLVEKISKVYSEEDNSICEKIYYWQSGGLREALINDERFKGKAVPGDIVFIGTDDKGFVNNIVHYFNFSAPEGEKLGSYSVGLPRAKHRRIYGTVYKTYDDLYTMTPEDLTILDGVEPELEEGHRYPTYAYIFDSTMEKPVRKAYASDFVGYSESIEDACKVFVFSTYMTDYLAVIYK